MSAWHFARSSETVGSPRSRSSRLPFGVGANAAVFSVGNATLIQPLPYADPDRLVAIFETVRRPAVERRAVSYPNFRDWRREARSFEAMSVILGSLVTVRIGDAR